MALEPEAKEKMGKQFRFVTLAGCWMALIAAFPAGCANSTPADHPLGDAPQIHPLDPLSAIEMAAAVEALKAEGKPAGGAVFGEVSLHEPGKDDVASFEPGKPFKRLAFLTMMEKTTGKTFEAVVDVAAKKVASWKEIPGKASLIFHEDEDEAEKIVKADPAWQAALAKRGLKPEQVFIDTWGTGKVAGAPDGERTLQSFTLIREDATNPYGRPVEGLVAMVGLTSKKILKLTDNGVRPVPAAGKTDFYDAKVIGKTRPALKPLLISQPEGVNFTVTGHEVKWDNWRFRWSHTPREGIVLNNVGWMENGKFRSILHRASVSEMAVPYADPTLSWRTRSAFDHGEYNPGKDADMLVPGLDVPANAKLFDSAIVHPDGKAETIPGCVAIYEKDGGVLWRHTWDNKVASRRGRELVITWMATVGNYIHAYFWTFTQNGHIHFRLELTGIDMAKGVHGTQCESCKVEGGPAALPADADQRYGALVDKNIAGINHQHFLNARLDFDIDGQKNSILEKNVGPDAGIPDNSADNAFVVRETVFKTEKEAQRDINPVTGRRWKIYNPNVKNSLGHFPGYMIEPDAGVMPMMGPNAIIRKRAAFVNHNLWVTPLRPGEKHAAGDYPNLSSGGDGLPAWTAGNANIENTDIVVWYNCGITHLTTTEDWPVMSTASAGFGLVPVGFFDHNPALDLPGENRKPAEPAKH